MSTSRRFVFPSGGKRKEVSGRVGVCVVKVEDVSLLLSLKDDLVMKKGSERG